MSEAILTSDNVEDLSECQIIPYPLPCNPDVTVHVKQIPVADLKRIGKQLEKQGPVRDAAEIELISKSTVNPNGTPVFDTVEKIKRLKEGNVPLYMSLVILSNRANSVPKSESEDLEDRVKN